MLSKNSNVIWPDDPSREGSVYTETPTVIKRLQTGAFCPQLFERVSIGTLKKLEH
jgi:hypothetical protein